MDDTQRKILDVARDFDLNEYEDETYLALEATSGEYDVSPDEAADESMPLSAALTVVAGSKSEGFRFLQEVAEQMLAQFSAKGEDVKATQDSRTLHATMALGIKKLLIEWGSRVAEAKERLEKTTPDERRKVGNIDELLHEEDAPVDNRPVGAPSAAVQSSTKRAQAFFAKKSDATRN